MNNHCLYCDAVIQEEMTWRKFLFGAPEQSLCKTCKGKLIIITDPVCRKCSRPFAKLEAEYIHEDICHDCFRWEKDSKWKGVLERNVSIYDYNDFLKEMLARYKYRGIMRWRRHFRRRSEASFQGRPSIWPCRFR